MTLKDFNETFQNELRDPEFAREFIRAALDESHETGDMRVFLVALRDVAQANRAMSRAANRAGVARPSLYKTLSEEGNPQFDTIFSILPEIGLRFTVETFQGKGSSSARARRRADAARAAQDSPQAATI